MINKKDISIAAEIMDSIIQTEEWTELQTNDPAVKFAEVRIIRIHPLTPSRGSGRAENFWTTYQRKDIDIMKLKEIIDRIDQLLEQANIRQLDLIFRMVQVILK